MSKVTVVSRPNRITIASKGVQGAVGPEGPRGLQGQEGEKGDTGDVTPEALAARDAAVGAASAAAGSASTASVAATTAGTKATEAAASAALAEQARLLGASIGFSTKADMDASLAHPAGTLALVTNDANPANSVTYRKTGASGSGSWVQSADRVTGLEGRVGGVEGELDDQAETLARVAAFRSSNGEDIEVLTDDRGALVRRTDSRGHVYVPDVGGDMMSIQGALQEARATSSFGSGPRHRDVWVVLDVDGNVIVRIDSRGAFYVPGSREPIQSAVGQTFSPAEFPRTEREKLHHSVKPLIADLMAEGLPFVPPPTMLVPNGYDVPDGFQSAFSVQQDLGIFLETPYGPGGLVHPHLIEMRSPFMGYRFILGETPHKHGNAWEENPIVYGSNDLKQFDLIPDIPQPLGYPPGGMTGYNSDIAWTYDPRRGELIAVWRSAVGTERKFHYRGTYDGVNWGPEQVVLMTSGGQEWLSPAILYDPIGSVWHLWVVWTQGEVRHFTGPSHLGPWAQAGSQNFNLDHGINVWHIEVKWLGDRFAILANVDGENSNLWLGLSDDGNEWDMGPELISPQAPYVYKGTFIPQFDGNNCRIHVAWNTYAFPLPPGMEDSLHVVSSNWADLTSI